MKKFLLFFVFCFSTAIVSAQEIEFELYTGDKAGAQELSSAAEREGAKLKQAGSATVWKYGTIEKSSTGVRFFKFKNTGSAPLIISKAKGSCGCTVPSYPKEPILPGQAEYIKVKYDTKRVGAFTKYVTLTTNAKTNSTVRLKINGTVEAEAPATPAKEKGLFGQ